MPAQRQPPDDPIESFYQEHCSYLVPMLGWFLFSSLLSSYNKYVFGSSHLSFPCPLLLTSIHFGTQWIFAEFACKFWSLGGERVESMSWKQWAMVSIPCGLVTSGDVGLSNLSMVYITITFYTMVKASAPIFVLLWAYLFGIERITWGLIGVVVIICMGEFVTVAGEVDFQLKGFLLCLSATILSGARWTLVQLKLQNLDPPLKTTIATMKLLAPSMCLSMVVLSVAIEEPWNKFGSFSVTEMGAIWVLGLVGATLAICMILCEFWLILHASAVILMIGGVIKELLTIAVGVMFFNDKLNLSNFVGFTIVFIGVVVYKIQHMQAKEEREEGGGEGSYEPILNEGADGNDSDRITEDDVVLELSSNGHAPDELSLDSEKDEESRIRSEKGSGVYARPSASPSVEHNAPLRPID